MLFGAVELSHVIQIDNASLTWIKFAENLLNVIHPVQIHVSHKYTTTNFGDFLENSYDSNYHNIKGSTQSKLNCSISHLKV